MSGLRIDEMEVSDWGKWANHVLAEIKRLHETTEELRRDLNELGIEVSKLKVKSGAWGAVAGALTVIMIFIVGWAKSASEEDIKPQIIYVQPSDSDVVKNKKEEIIVVPKNKRTNNEEEYENEEDEENDENDEN